MDLSAGTQLETMVAGRDTPTRIMAQATTVSLFTSSRIPDVAPKIIVSKLRRVITNTYLRIKITKHGANIQFYAFPQRFGLLG